MVRYILPLVVLAGAVAAPVRADADDEARAAVAVELAKLSLKKPQPGPAPAPAPKEKDKYDPYGFSSYEKFYAHVGRGGAGVLVVGLTDPYVGTYQPHCRVPSGFGGLADGEYDCRLENGVQTVHPRKSEQKAAPEAAAPKTFRSGGYNGNHTCPNCGHTSAPGTGTWIVRGHNSDGTHTHQCPLDGTTWRH